LNLNQDLAGRMLTWLSGCHGESSCSSSCDYPRDRRGRRLPSASELLVEPAQERHAGLPLGRLRRQLEEASPDMYRRKTAGGGAAVELPVLLGVVDVHSKRRDKALAQTLLSPGEASEVSTGEGTSCGSYDGGDLVLEVRCCGRDAPGSEDRVRPEAGPGSRERWKPTAGPARWRSSSLHSAKDSVVSSIRKRREDFRRIRSATGSLLRHLNPRDPSAAADATRWQRSSSFELECEALAAPSLPKGRAPIASRTCPRGTQLCGILASLERGALPRFLREALGCRDVEPTPWTPHLEAEGDESSMVQRMVFAMPMPRDLPEAVYRLVRIPDVVEGSTLSCVRSGEGELILTQRCRISGAPYSDRFRIEHTYSFRRDAAGQVVFAQWTEVVWTLPLPWTHKVIVSLLEAKVKAETLGLVGDFLEVIIRDSSPDGSARSDAAGVAGAEG